MEIEKRSMESGSHSAGNYNVHLYAKILVALLCFILVLFSFIFMVTSSHAADPNQMQDRMATITITLTSFRNTATATSTPTPTPTATNTPTPTPTATRTPRPTPTATLSAAATAIPTATATRVKATSTVGTVTASPTIGQTPTSVPGGSATTTTNNTGNGTPPSGQQGSGLGIVFFPLLIGALLFVSIVIVLGFLFLRKSLLPPQPLRVNLPPSGAQPWRRVRTGSMNGNTNIAGDPLQNNGPTLILPVTTDSSEPDTEKIKLVTRRGTRLVKLEETRQGTKG
jgi:hypothetical protein